MVPFWYRTPPPPPPSSPVMNIILKMFVLHKEKLSHVQVAFEDFNKHMSKVYHHYEQQRTDDIVDPAERQQRPISTISGVGAQEVKPVPKSTVRISEISEDEAAELQKSGTELCKLGL